MSKIMLKGARHIVFEALQEALKQGEEPSITDISDMTYYSEATVKAAINDLAQMGIIQVTRPGRGHKYSYKILIS